MTQPLTGHRSRSDLIAELYERHAAGLFAYCHDQLGETASAADALVAVLTSVPGSEPQRAALYALARREIYRRDVSYALPAVDSVADPATALIERVFRDIRPHQREVLLLSAVCGLNVSELSWVLDVAVDTATELTSSARNRFGQTLATAVTAAREAPFVPPDVAEIYDAIGVAPIEDVLARLPWRQPAHGVRQRVLSALPFEEPSAAQPSGLITKKLWPTTPVWPLPLKSPDEVSNACLVQAEGLAEPAEQVKPQGRRRHEAPTEPMPRIRGSILRVLSDTYPRRRRFAPQAPARPVDQVEALVEEGLATFEKMESFDAFTPTEETAAAEHPVEPRARVDAKADAKVDAKADTEHHAKRHAKADTKHDTKRHAKADTKRDSKRETKADTMAEATIAPAAEPVAEPVAQPAAHRAGDASHPVRPAVAEVAESATAEGQRSEAKIEATLPVLPAPDDDLPGGTTTVDDTPSALARAVQAGRESERPRRRERKRKVKPIKVGEHHYDWLWELIGFAICLAIALLVFFSVPTLVTP
ncbi:hypothetical protein Aple_031530 [Acrocarpospora pleiomorpha]|uniref:Uncharacterized protein n=1 Tax=Acrocarpospora pleiomorpha TaxID=90975 RepID=A0A5M3XF76_9ACTN|nr:hypothetical protein [Acrocarpospora pleiomorpha]GES20257.1 hypothetical protein Aple_031530 [Acrocarpospora pleiomorpha]